MNILLVLIPVTVLVIVIAVALFFWAVNHQQFDDLDSPGVVPLLDDPPPADASTQATPATPTALATAPATAPSPADATRDP